MPTAPRRTSDDDLPSWRRERKVPRKEPPSIIANEFRTNFKWAREDHRGSYVAARESVRCQERKQKAAVLRRSEVSVDADDSDEDASAPAELRQLLHRCTNGRGDCHGSDTILPILRHAAGSTGAVRLARKSLFYVKELTLWDSSIDTLPSHFGRLFPSLRVLNLERNQLTTIPASILECAGLEEWRAGANRLTSLPRLIGNLENLSYLDVSRNRLSALPETLPALKDLTHLDLSGNCLCHLAIQPLMTDYEESVQRQEREASFLEKMSAAKFEEVIDPQTRQTLYYDRNSGETTATRPVSDQYSMMQVRAPGIPQKLQGFISKEAGELYQDRRRFLALQNIPEWDISTENGRASYANNVSGETTAEMPRSLDRWTFPKLTCLKLNDNRLVFLPESMTKLSELDVLEARRNEIAALPCSIGNLSHLRCLKIGSNKLEMLPPSICNCRKMVHLDLSNNQLERIPSDLVNLSGLTTLHLQNNNIKQFPLQFGFLETLTDCNLANNPLEDILFEVLVKGTQAILWTCREKQRRLTQGSSPPIVQIHGSGVQNECLELVPSFASKLALTMNEAKLSSHRLELQQMNLNEVPRDVFGMHGLLHLDLSRNHLAAVIEWPADVLSSLQVLVLRNCAVKEISPTIQNLTGLLDMNLECNDLCALPNDICELRRVRQLRVANNKLSLLPESIAAMADLEELACDRNQLLRLPRTLTSLSKLVCLSLSQNRLTQVPGSLAKISSLRQLNLSQNYISFLPGGFGSLSLSSLKLSHNSLEMLEDDCFLPHLGTTLEELWLDSNNLVELPRSICSLKETLNVKLALNPLQNPPAELLEEGIPNIMNYCSIRTQRLDDMHRLLRKSGFSSLKDNLHPVARQAITGDSGYLLPSDLAGFDQVVDKCLNGKFFLYAETVKDVVQAIAKLREERESSTNRRILNEVIRFLWDDAIQKEDTYFRNDLMRPWGRKGEMVRCFALSRRVLFEGAGHGPSIHALVKEALPDLTRLFGLDSESVTNAYTNFRSPYGSVAALENVSFGDADEMRKVPSVVIVRKIYTPEEADRRQKEDDLLDRLFAKMEATVDCWAEKKDGVRSINVEVTRRIKHATAQWKETKSELKRAKSNDLRTAHDVVRFAKARRKDYEDGRPYPLHRIETDEEAANVVAAAERNLSQMKERIARLEDEVVALQNKRERMDRQELRATAVADMKKKHCYYLYTKVYRFGRNVAFSRNLERPWDGPDGKEFHAFKRRVDESAEQLWSLSEEAFRDEIENHISSAAFVWSDTSDMAFYENVPYSRYKKTFVNQIIDFLPSKKQK